MHYYGILPKGAEAPKNELLTRAPCGGDQIVLAWEGEACPVTDTIFEPNRFQTGIVYWFIEKRNWYTHGEILDVLKIN